MDSEKLVLGVSACLLGREVRFDGGHKRDGFLVNDLSPFVEWYPICPELEAGMGIPREPVRLVRLGGDLRLRGTRSQTDWTERMAAAVIQRVEGLDRLDGFICKSQSPSCGMERVKVHPEGEGMPVKEGVGLFAAALTRRWPNLPVEEEGRLHDPFLRDGFLERVVVYGRLHRLWDGPWRPRDVVAFHTAHKMAVLAHDPEGYRALGRLVARAGSLSPARLRDEYERGLMTALARPTSRGRHVNTLEHLVGHLRGGVDAQDGRELRAAIADYRSGRVPLVVPLTLVRHHVRRLGVRYIEGQTYLQPHPPELGLRSHV